MLSQEFDSPTSRHYGNVAQFGRAARLQREGCGFKPRHFHPYNTSKGCDLMFLFFITAILCCLFVIGTCRSMHQPTWKRLRFLFFHFLTIIAIYLYGIYAPLEPNEDLGILVLILGALLALILHLILFGVLHIVLVVKRRMKMQ